MESKKTKYKYLLIYTVCFIVLYFICFGVYFIIYQKSFFRSYDGLDQHYLIFMNCGKWIRKIFKNIFINHSFNIPLWNNGIGYGADILTSNAAYYPDIFNWLSVFIPSRYSEIGFNIIIVLKFYVTGLAFSYFGFYKKQSFWAVLTGSIIYTFSGVMYIAFIESFFVNPMYILPIVMVGVDKLLKEKKSSLYVFSLAYAFINYFYFGYMISIFIFIYCLLSFCIDKDIEKNTRNFFNIMLKFIIYSIIGIGISMIVVLPIINILGGADRLKLRSYIPLLYDKNWYVNFARGFITSFSMSGRDAIIGFGALSLPAVICIFMQNKKYTKQKIEFILITIGLCIPIIGSIMNGFSYYANRWCFVYALLISYMITISFEEFKQLTKEKNIILVSISFLYVSIIIILFNRANQGTITASIFTLLCTFICAISSWIPKKIYKYLYLSLAIISVSISSYYNYNQKYGNATNKEVVSGTAYNKIMNNGGVSLLNEIDNSDCSRYDENNLGRVRNASWVYEISGMDFYISIYNNDIDNFHNNIGLLTGASPMDYHGLNKRSELEALFGVNHYIVNSNNIENKPYGYDNLEMKKTVNGNEFFSYSPVNKNQLVYGFKKSIKQSDYNKLSPFDKQQVLTQAVVVEDNIANSNLDDLKIENDIINYKISKDENISIDSNIYNVYNDDSIINLNFENISNSEIYVYFDNINYENNDISNYNINIQAYNNDTLIENENANLNGLNNKSHMYGAKHQYLINLGYTDEDVNKIKLKFKKGTYSIDNIIIYARHKDEIQNSIKNIDHIAEGIKYTTNKFEYNIKLEENENVFISVPYSKGWKAYANGEEKRIIKVDDAFMALQLEKRRI